jgi:hypothetical protein
MTPEQALQVLVGLINQAEFKGSISTITQIGEQGNQAIKVLADFIKPQEKAVE